MDMLSLPQSPRSFQCRVSNDFIHTRLSFETPTLKEAEF